MPDLVSQDELTSMVLAATLGRPFVPSTPRAREVWERIQQQVAEIAARPGVIVDIPSDIPEIDPTQAGRV